MNVNYWTSMWQSLSTKDYLIGGTFKTLMLEKELKAYASWQIIKEYERGKRKEEKNYCPVFLKKMDFKESCNLHILSLSFVWYSCSFYLIMLWGREGDWESINKCSNYLLTCLSSRPFYRVMFLLKFIFGLSAISVAKNQVLAGQLGEFFFRYIERVFQKRHLYT